MVKKSVDDFDIDAELFGDDMMPNWGDVEQDKKRSVVADIKSELLQGVKSAAADRNNWISFAKRALPRDYEYGIDTALDTYRDVNEELRKTVNKLKPIAGRLGATVERALPDKFKKLKSSAAALKDWGKGYRSNYDANKAKEDAITAELSKIFNAQMEQQIRSDQETKTKQQIDGLIDFQRHKESTGLLKQMTLDISRLTNYQISITQAYQKKSLELQFRSFNIQKDLYELQKKTSHDTVTALTAIVKNTGLPDFVKIKKTELLRQNINNRFYNAVIDKFSSIASIDNIRKAFLKNLSTGAGSFIDLLGSGVDMGEMALDMKQMMDDMGMDESQLPGWAKTILPMISGTFVGEGMKWAGGKLRRRLGNDSRIRTGAKQIRRFKASPDLVIQDIARRLSPDLGDNFNDTRYQKAVEEYRKKRDELVINHGEDSPEVEELDNKNPENNQHMFYGAPLHKKLIAHFFSQLSSATRQARDPTFSGFSKKKDLLEATPFSVQAHESITKVIPGYLARILRESEYTTSLLKSEPGKRSKVERNDLQLFDWENNGFIAKKDLQTRTEAAIKSSRRYNTSYGAIGKFIQKTKTTDKNVRDVIMDALYDAKGRPDVFANILKSRSADFKGGNNIVHRGKLLSIAKLVNDPRSELHISFLEASNELIEQEQYGASHLQELDRYQTRDVLSTLGVSSDGKYTDRGDKAHWMQTVRSQNTLYDPSRVEDIRKIEEEEIQEQETDNGFSKLRGIWRWLFGESESDISRKDIITKLGSYKDKVSSKLGSMTKKFTELGRSIWTYKDSKQNQLAGLDPNIVHEGVMAQDTYRLGMSASDRTIDGLTTINALLKSQQEISITLNEILKRMDSGHTPMHGMYSMYGMYGMPGMPIPGIPMPGSMGSNSFVDWLRTTASMAGRGAMGIGRAWMGMLGGGFNLAKNTLGTYLPKGFALASNAVRGSFGVLSSIKNRLVGDITDVSGNILASLDDLRDGKIIAIGPDKKEMLIRTVDDMEKAAKAGYTQLQRITSDAIDGGRKTILDLNESIRGKYFLKAPWMRVPIDLLDKVFKFYKRVGGAVIGALPRGWQMVANATKFGFKTVTGLIDKPLDIYSKKSFKEAPKGTVPEPKIRKEDFEAGILQDIKGKTISRPSDIKGPVFRIDGEGRTMVLTQEDLLSGLVDGQGNPITLSISGKLKDIGKGILNKGIALGKGYINLLRKGISGAGRAVSGIWRGIRSALGGLGIDTQLGIIGGDEFLERLTEIRDILDERMPGKKTFRDTDGDGDREGSVEDQRQKADKTSWWERIKKKGTSLLASLTGKGKDKDKDKDGDDSWWSKLGLGAFGVWFLGKVKAIINGIFGFLGKLINKIPGMSKLLQWSGIGGGAGAASNAGKAAGLLGKLPGWGKLLGLGALTGTFLLGGKKVKAAELSPEQQQSLAELQAQGIDPSQLSPDQLASLGINVGKGGSSILGTGAKAGAVLGGMWSTGKLLGNKGGIVGATARTAGKIARGIGSAGLGLGRAVLPVGKGFIGGARFAVGKLFTPLAVLDGLNDLRKGNYSGATLSLGSAALFTGTGMAALKTGAAAALSAISLPVALTVGGIAAVGGAGYLTYKYLTNWKQTELSQLRMLQYGLGEKDLDICKKVYQVERYLQTKAEITGDIGKFKGDIDVPKILDMLGLDPNDENILARFGEWFNNRFKPVFFTHLAAIYNIKKKKAIDVIDKELKSPKDKLEFIKKVAMTGGPWDVKILPFGKDAVTSITAEHIKKYVDFLIEKFGKDLNTIPAKSSADTILESMDATGYVHNKKSEKEISDDIRYKATGVETLKESNTKVAKTAIQNMKMSLAAEGKMKGIPVQSKSITDWIFKQPVNAIHAIKYKAYGLTKMDQSQVSSIRWLELVCYKDLKKKDDHNVEFIGDGVAIVEDAAQYFGFGTENKKQNEKWIKWFYGRFLPVFTTYTALVMQLSNGSNNFRVNESTFNYQTQEALDLANKLVGMSSIWTVDDSPWPDNKLSNNPDICTENLEFLKENIKKKELVEEAKQANTTSTERDENAPTWQKKGKELQDLARGVQTNNEQANNATGGSSYSSNQQSAQTHTGGSSSYESGGDAPTGITDVAARALQAARSRASESGARYVLGSGHGGKDPRQLNKAYDCSSFVGWSYTDAGINVPRHMPATADMRNAYTKLGFTWHSKNINSSNYKQELKPGDILLRELAVTKKTGHTEMYAGNGNLIGAHSSKSGVSERPKIFGNYNGYLRWEKGGTAVPAMPQAPAASTTPSIGGNGYTNNTQQLPFVDKPSTDGSGIGIKYRISQPGQSTAAPGADGASTSEEYKYERPKDEKKAAAYDQLKKIAEDNTKPEASRAAARKGMEQIADRVKVIPTAPDNGGLPNQSNPSTNQQTGGTKFKSGSRKERLLKLIWAGFKKHGITNRNEIAAFLAMVHKETGALRALSEEKSSYASSRSRWKGRGILQLTTERNYRAYSNFLKRSDIMSNPDIVATDENLAVDSGFFFWIHVGKQGKWAREGKFKEVRFINGFGTPRPEARRMTESAMRAIDLNGYLKLVNMYLQGKGPLWYNGPIDMELTGQAMSGETNAEDNANYNSTSASAEGGDTNTSGSTLSEIGETITGQTGKVGGAYYDLVRPGGGYARSVEQIQDNQVNINTEKTPTNGDAANKIIVTAPTESAAKALNMGNFEVKTSIAEINSRIVPCDTRYPGPKHIVNNLVCVTDRNRKWKAPVYKDYAPYFQGFIIELENAGYKITYRLSGYRPASSTANYSRHRFGAAIDIDSKFNKYTYPRGGGRVQKHWKEVFHEYLGPNFESIIDKLCEKWSIDWGADYQDLMHFEVRPRKMFRPDAVAQAILDGRRPMPRIPIPLPGSIDSSKSIDTSTKIDEKEAKEEDGTAGDIPTGGGGAVAEQGSAGATGTTGGSSGASTSGSSGDTTLGKEYGSLTPGGGIGGALGNLGGTNTSERPSPVAEAYGLQKTALTPPPIQPGMVATDKAIASASNNMERIAGEQLVVLKQILSAVQDLGKNSIMPFNDKGFNDMIGGVLQTSNTANVGAINTALQNAIGPMTTQIGNMTSMIDKNFGKNSSVLRSLENFTRNARGNGLPISTSHGKFRVVNT